MWLVFIFRGLVSAQYCANPSSHALHMASMAFNVKPSMIKDRFGITIAENDPITKDDLDKLINKWLNE